MAFLFAPFFRASSKPPFRAVRRTSPLEFFTMERARRWNSLSEFDSSRISARAECRLRWFCPGRPRRPGWRLATGGNGRRTGRRRFGGGSNQPGHRPAMPRVSECCQKRSVSSAHARNTSREISLLQPLARRCMVYLPPVNTATTKGWLASRLLRGRLCLPGACGVRPLDLRARARAQQSVCK